MLPSTDLPRIAISTGEPAGIGPDITIQIAQQNIAADIVVIGDPNLLQSRADTLGLPLTLCEFDDTVRARHVAKQLRIIPLYTAKIVVAGQLNQNNAAYVLSQLQLATQGCLNKTFDAMVTTPIQKSIINDAGYVFTGHTEYLADLCKTQAVMMLANDILKVALVTTHLPLSKVSVAITKEHLTRTLQIIHHELQKKFLLEQPTILICGLNPHAGEDGHLGHEENDIIIPVINILRNQGLDLHGPQSADTAFIKSTLERFDVIVTMYHDQGLPVLKSMGFGDTVNITLGLPIVRTSVDHGTALHLAGTGDCSSTSLMTAIQYAIKISHNISATSALINSASPLA